MSQSRIVSRRLSILAIAALAFALAPSVALAQVTDDELGDVGAFLTLFPALRAAPAPAFVVPRVRVTYETGSAAFGTGTGTGASGGGILQYDIVQTDVTQVLAILQSYANDGNGYYPLGSGYVRGYPGLGSFWMNPQALVGAESLGGQGLTVTRTQKTLASGATFNVVRFQTQTQGGQTVFEFDTETGVMVFNSISSPQSASQIVLVSVRQLNLPWEPARAPNWVRPGAKLAYSGSQTTTLPGTGTLPGTPFELAMEVLQAGPQWSLGTASTRLNGQDQGSGPVATGEAQMGGGLWMSRGALDRQYPAEGLTVDTDPVTGATVFMGRDESGNLVVQQVTPVSRTTSIYEPRLGVLNRVIQEVQYAVSQETIDLARVTPDADLDVLAAQPPLTGPPATGGNGGGQGILDGNAGSGGCSATPAPQIPWWFLAICGVALGVLRRKRARLTPNLQPPSAKSVRSTSATLGKEPVGGPGVTLSR